MTNKQTPTLKRYKEKVETNTKQQEVKLNLFDFPTKEKSFLGYNFLDCLFKTMKQKIITHYQVK